MYENEELRVRLIDYVTNHGVSYLHISKKTNIHKSLLSMFKNSKRDLTKENINKLNDYLNTK